MDFFRKIMVLFIFLITVYILFRLIQKRRELLALESFTEGIAEFTNPQVISLSKLNKTPNTIQNVPAKYKEKPLHQFFIKSSFNTAYDGTTVSTDMVGYILSRGYRFLDFEVYYETITTEPDGSPTATVALSEYGKFPRTSSNNILLSDVFKKIKLGAFTTLSPNPNDPLFIQLRPMYQDIKDENGEDNVEAKIFNGRLNTSIKQALGVFDSDSLMKGPVSPKTKLKAMCATELGRAKIVIVMDTTHIRKDDDLLTKIHMTQNDMVQLFIPRETEAATPTEKPKEEPKLSILHPYGENKTILPNNLNSYKVVSLLKPNIMPVIAWYSSTNVILFNNLGPSTLAQYEKMFITNQNTAFIELDKLVIEAEKETKINSRIVA
jgi:hypothetical protein